MILNYCPVTEEEVRLKGREFLKSVGNLLIVMRIWVGDGGLTGLLVCVFLRRCACVCICRNSYCLLGDYVYGRILYLRFSLLKWM